MVLHAIRWAATYPHVRYPPTAELRERQWRAAFAKRDGRWFCFVIENARQELVGFETRATPTATYTSAR